MGKWYEWPFGKGDPLGPAGGETISEPPIVKKQKDVGMQLGELLLSGLSKYSPGASYGGQLSADMSPFEKFGLGTLGKYLEAPATGELYGAGKQQIMDTLGGKFANPQESPYIKSMINLSKMNLADQIDVSRRGAGARGSYFTDSAIREEGRLGESTQNFLNTLIGQFIESERGRQFQAAPIAQEMDRYGMATAPLTQVGASQSFGALSRTLEQSDLERKYQDFLRQRGELSAMPGQAQAFSQGATGPASVTTPLTYSGTPVDAFAQTMQAVLPFLLLM